MNRHVPLHEPSRDLARDLAKKPYAPPKQASEPWADMSYDQYRDIRVRPEAIAWRGKRKVELHILPVGWLFKNPVEINIVDRGVARPMVPSNALFNFGPLVKQPAADAPPIEFSGFRVNGPINRPNVFDEIAVFQGASYFRAVSKGQTYGLSGHVASASNRRERLPFVMAGSDPAIHVDPRDKPGDDDEMEGNLKALRAKPRRAPRIPALP